ncbi:hypothetical protein DXG01_009627 [Tephrocybe rancida]|nr:hypothetical protein DXG01_009627 [Tephrocybe rancida]
MRDSMRDRVKEWDRLKKRRSLGETGLVGEVATNASEERKVENDKLTAEAPLLIQQWHELNEQLGSQNLRSTTIGWVGDVPFLEGASTRGCVRIPPLPALVLSDRLIVGGLYCPEPTIVSVNPDLWSIDTKAHRPKRWLAQEGSGTRELQAELSGSHPKPLLSTV